MARAIQQANKKYRIYNDSQKGFIQKTNGCSEHAILLNELVHHASRKRKNIVATAIDFSNAFGSVPQEMILSVMQQRGFPEWMCQTVKEMYTGASSVVEVRGRRTPHVAWKRGVKQGCPLSPLLFNLCLEAFIEAIHKRHAGEGVQVEVEEGKEEVLMQAYADDIILLSSKPEHVQRMLRTLEEFTKWSRMDVNTAKCATASYLIDRAKHRCSLAEELTFNGNRIPNLTLGQSMKYLGTAVAARRSVKLESIRAKLAEARLLVKRIVKSKLLTVQKIDAIKTFVIPSLDFALLNGDVGLKDLRELDAYIRGAIDELLTIPGLPVDVHHASWRDGGLSYPSLVDRQEVLKVRSFTQMLTSNDAKIRKIMRKFVDEERDFRKIDVDEYGTFLDWKEMQGIRGTASIIGRTRQACAQLGISIKATEKEDTLKIGINGHGEKPIKAAQVGRLLTQNIIRVRRYEGLIQNEVHGATFKTLKDNTVSNKMMTNIFTKASNAFFRFVIAARTDSLATPANIRRWYNTVGDRCRRCGAEQVPTLAHILNGCTQQLDKMTERHNALSKLIKGALYEQLGNQITDGIHDNVTLGMEELPEELRRQKPDLSFSSNIGGVPRIELIEFSCPYGYVSQPDEQGNCVNSMERAYRKKHRKYAPLAKAIQEMRGTQVRVTVIIVSSLGAVYKESLKEIGQLTRCTKEVLRKLAKKMSYTVVNGSMKLWREYAKNMDHNHGREEADARVEAEIQRIEEERQEEARQEELNREAVEIVENEEGIEVDEEEIGRTEERNQRDIVDEPIELGQLES
jgi:hypothetical protein